MDNRNLKFNLTFRLIYDKVDYLLQTVGNQLFLVYYMMLPSGIYYVGDLCYIIEDDDKWVKICDSIENGEGKVGKYKYAIGHTKYGDGRYYDNFNNSYGVDSGTIGIIELKAKDTKEDIRSLLERKLGMVFSFQVPVYVFFSDGLFKIGDIEIDTR